MILSNLTHTRSPFSPLMPTGPYSQERKKNNSVSRSQSKSQQQFVIHHSAHTGLPRSPGLPGCPLIPGTPGDPGVPWKTNTQKNPTITAMFMANHSTETIITMFNPRSQFPASVVVGGYSIPPHSHIHKHTSRHTRLMILGVPKLVQCMWIQLAQCLPAWKLD